MRKLQVKTEPEEENRAKFAPVFTSYQIANDILNDYRTQMREEGIYFGVEGEAIAKTVLEDEAFADVLTHLMSIATEEAIKACAGSYRYIRVRAMCAQKKLFLKVKYSSECDQTTQSEDYVAIQNAMEECAGYIKLENGRDSNTLYLAVPIGT